MVSRTMNRFDLHRKHPAACLHAVGPDASSTRTLLLLGVEIDFFDFCGGTHHEVLAPERNREHSIGDQVAALNVGFMERLPRVLSPEPHKPSEFSCCHAQPLLVWFCLPSLRSGVSRNEILEYEHRESTGGWISNFCFKRYTYYITAGSRAMSKKAVIVFSGGQDSTTCLIHALPLYDEIHCITFDYGQRHRAEIEVAQHLSKKLGVIVHKVLDTSLLNELAISSLTRDNIPVPAMNSSGESLPSTFVPGRNILFLTLASIYAYQVQAKAVITGVCETDFSGYPDCRDAFVKALNKAIELGMEYKLLLETPLMWLNKAETWALADYHNKLDLIRHHTLSCYNGIKGSGCANCDACNLRSKGLNDYLGNKAEIMHSLKAKLKLK